MPCEAGAGLLPNTAEPLHVPGIEFSVFIAVERRQQGGVESRKNSGTVPGSRIIEIVHRDEPCRARHVFGNDARISRDMAT